MNTLTHLTRPVFNWLLQTTWEATVLAVLILLAQLAFRKKLPPNWRYGLWLLLVARLLMPALPPSTFSIFNLARMDVLHRASVVRPATSLENAAPAAFPAGAPSIAPESASRAAAPPMSPSVSDAAARLAVSTPRASSGSETWFAVAGGIWLGGACLLGLRLLLANLRFRSHVRCYVPVKDERITRLLADCAALLGVRRQVTLIETEEADSPAVWGLWHRRMLLPEGVFARFTPAELRHVFLHELAHLKRHDLEVSWLVAFLQILHWFNPVLWLAFTRMRADRELAVDALVLAHTREGGGVCYGETILKVLEGFKRQTVLPGLVGIGESKARIKERLEAMSRREVAKSWRWAAVGIALGLGGLALTDAVETNKPAPTKTKDPNPPAQCRAMAESPGRLARRRPVRTGNDSTPIRSTGRIHVAREPDSLHPVAAREPARSAA